MRSAKPLSTLALGALLAPLLAGCTSPSELGRPEWARVVLTSSAALSMELLVSQNFLVSEQSVQLIDFTVDTVSVPFDKTYDLGAPARFYVQAKNLSEQTIIVRFKVVLEPRTWMDENKTLAPGEKAEFVYRYNEPVFY